MSTVALQSRKTHTQAADTHAPWVVDGMESFDLRPVVAAIMKAENWILERLSPGQKLFLILGEQHNSFVDHFIHHATLNAHVRQAKKHKDRTFAYGTEFPYNFLLRSTGKTMDDPDGVHGMNAYFDHTEKTTACIEPISAIFRQCIRDRISVSFNDISATDIHIDMDDPYTIELLGKNKGLIKGTLKDKYHRVECPIGSSLSNLSQVERSIAHAERTNVKIYIVDCGNLHVAGSRNHNWWYSHSLSKLFTDKGHAVLPVINNFGSFGYNLSDDARKMMDETGIKIRDLAYAFERPSGVEGGFYYMDYEEARAEVNRYSYYDP